MFQGTTIIAVRKGGKTAIAGDGQVTLGQNTVMKQTANKIRRIYEGRIVAGFAGSVADAFTLFSRFEEKLRQSGGNLTKAGVELARDWRSDRVLRRLEALLVVADREKMLLISGNGELIEPDDGITGIGSGGPYALAAARALIRYTDMDAEEVARSALTIAADICVYTNHHITVETIE